MIATRLLSGVALKRVCPHGSKVSWYSWPALQVDRGDGACLCADRMGLYPGFSTDDRQEAEQASVQEGEGIRGGDILPNVANFDEENQEDAYAFRLPPSKSARHPECRRVDVRSLTAFNMNGPRRLPRANDY